MSTKAEFKLNGGVKLAAIDKYPLTFGIEIETIGNAPHDLARKLHAAGIANVEAESYNHRDNDQGQWKIVTDSSLRSSTGAEVVSPILTGEAGIAEIIRMADAIKAVGSTVSSACGLHVHFGAKSVPLKIRKRFLKLFVRWEQVLDALINADRRGARSQWAAPVLQYRSFEAINERLNGITNAATHNDLAYLMGGRYQKVNVSAAYQAHGTYEVRMHHGTVDSKEIVEWVTILSELWRWALAGLSSPRNLKANKSLNQDVRDFGGRLGFYDSPLSGDFLAKIELMGAVTRAPRRRRARAVDASAVVTVNGEACPCLDCQINGGIVRVEA